MQIHELNTFSGTPGGTDFLPIDTGFDTAKISARDLLKPIKDQADQLNQDKVNMPKDEHNQPDNGTNGQLLRTKGDGSTEWVDEGLPTDAQTAQAISDWLDAHPEATTTVTDGSLTESKFSDTLKQKTIKDYVTPEMFGAVGDGVTNDYDAFSLCADYARANGIDILIPSKQYYLNGNSSIKLYSNVECLGSVFIVGDSHFKTTNPLFEYIHDSEIANVAGVMSDFIVSNTEVAADYSNKFFILDTGIAYGTPVSDTAEPDETIKEAIFTRDTDTKIYFVDDVSSYLSSAVIATNISDMNELGYCFKGAVIRQKTENSFGICFMRIRRNNMSVKNIQIEANNTQGQGSVFLCEYCNNLTFDDIKSFSNQPNLWTYEISGYYCANLLVNNFKGFNEWSSIATRGMKNYTLKNSITTTFDCHWNAYGTFLCENCYLFSFARLGYGRGDFIVKDTVCDYVSHRIDYVQIWCGTITAENVRTKQGFWINIQDDDSSGYDSFFNTIELPSVNLIRITASTRTLYMRIPDSVVSRLGTKNFLIIDSCPFAGVSVPYTNKAFKAILKSIPFTVGGRSTLKNACDIVYDDNVCDIKDIDSTKFTSINGQARKSGNIVCLNFTGILSESISSWNTMFSLPAGFRPSVEVYATAILGNNAVPVFISTGGNVQPTVAISDTSKRFILSTAFVLNDIY